MRSPRHQLIQAEATLGDATERRRRDFHLSAFRATRTVSSMVKRAVPTSNVSAMLGRVASR